MFSPLDQLWASSNVMGLFSALPLHGGNMESGGGQDPCCSSSSRRGTGDGASEGQAFVFNVMRTQSLGMLGCPDNSDMPN